MKTALGLALAGQALPPAAAQETGQTAPSGVRRWMEQDYMFGDWGGLRTDLSQHGIDFEFSYAGSVPANLQGGIKTGAVYQGALLMLLSLDSEKLVGYEGGQFYVSSMWLHGQKPFSDDYVGDLNKVNLLDFPNSFRLWELFYQQKLLDDKLTVKLGQMSVDHDFIVPEYYNSLSSLTLLNQTFFFPTLAFDLWDIPGYPPRYHGLPSTPYAAPAALLRIDPLPQFYAQAAVYGGYPDQSSSGTSFLLSESQGALFFFEVGYALNQQEGDAGLQGSYKLGGFYHTGSFVDVYGAGTAAFLSMAGLPASAGEDHHGDYAAYLLAEQQLFRELDNTDPAKQGLVGFFRVAGAPSDRNLAQFGIDGGLVYKGLIPKRDWDTLALAATYLQISDDIRRAQSDINSTALAFGAAAPFSSISDYEAALELSYKLQLTAWWTVQPDFQYVFHPGGSAAISDAVVFIIQTTLRF